MTTEHHTQRIDFGENGFLEATRDDTEEIQDFRLKAFLPDGRQVRERRVVYNIQYDYYRWQTWKSGELIEDYLDSREGYGHLQWEFSLQPPDGWSEKNPYPDNYEPVKPEGCDMFHWEGYRFGALLLENKIDAAMNCYIYDDLEEWRKPNLNLITEVQVATSRSELDDFEECAASECEDLKKNPFDPVQAREKRLKFLKKYGKVIGVTIPYDPRFID